jgi:flagellar biosynthetic protein FliP
MLALGALSLLGADRPPAVPAPAARANAPLAVDGPAAPATTAVIPTPRPTAPASPGVANPNPAPAPTAGGLDPAILGQSAARALPSVAIFALASLVPAGVLMLTAFVRINIVLTLLRQALGSPQVPGNQVLMALSLLLTAIVMQPAAERVYRQGIAPYAEGRLGPEAALAAGGAPLKDFMLDQIIRTGHQDYLWTLYAHARPDGDDGPAPATLSRAAIPMRVVAPAYLISELTTALWMGFAIYLPFLVIDLVVAAVLAAMGLFLLPPTLVALPLKLILFVLADGWMLVADMLLRSFARGG